MRGEFMNGKIKIGLISDIHEDIDALDRYLEYVEKNNIDIGICLGDSVSTYCDDDTNYFWKKSLQISKQFIILLEIMMSGLIIIKVSILYNFLIYIFIQCWKISI